jgi:hypothetical protein
MFQFSKIKNKKRNRDCVIHYCQSFVFIRIAQRLMFSFKSNNDIFSTANTNWKSWRIVLLRTTIQRVAEEKKSLLSSLLKLLLLFLWFFVFFPSSSSSSHLICSWNLFFLATLTVKRCRSQTKLYERFSIEMIYLLGQKSLLSKSLGYRVALSTLKCFRMNFCFLLSQTC